MELAYSLSEHGLMPAAIRNFIATMSDRTATYDLQQVSLERTTHTVNQLVCLELSLNVPSRKCSCLSCCAALQTGVAPDFSQKAFPPVAQPDALKSAASPPMGTSPPISFGVPPGLKMQVSLSTSPPKSKIPKK